MILKYFLIFGVITINKGRFMVQDVQYITDSEGSISSVIIPIEYWNMINCADETEYLLQNEKNRARLIEALNRNESLPKEEAYERFGI